MKKSHERWNEYQAASSEYPKELYKTAEKLEKRIKKETLKKKFLFTSIPTVSAAILFVILVNTSIVFARTIAEIPLLSKIQEMVTYNDALTNAVKNHNIQYVNLRDTDGEIELGIPYVIADSRNLILFTQMPENLHMEEDEFYIVEIKDIKDQSTGEIISQGYFSSRGAYDPSNINTEQFGLTQVKLEFIERPLPQNLDISLELVKYKNNDGELKPLGSHSFQYKLYLDDFVEPIIYELNQEILLDGQKVIFKEMISYPTRSEINMIFPDENDSEVSLWFSLIKDGVKYPLMTYAEVQWSYETHTQRSIYIDAEYFDPPTSRSISIDEYSKRSKDIPYTVVNLENRTMEPKIEGIELFDIVRENGKLSFYFQGSEKYTKSPFSGIKNGTQDIPIRSGGNGKGNLHRYTIPDAEYENLTFMLGTGPVTILEEPILIPIPVK